MTATIMDGKALSKTVREGLAVKTAALLERGIVPGLAVVLVGDDAASQIYVRNKGRAAAKVGIETFDHKLPASTPQADLVALIEALNTDDKVDGILVQLPVPDHIDAAAVQDTVDPRKDVDGLHPHSIGLLSQGRPGFVSCTPKGCMRLLAEATVEISGAHAVVIGRSALVGKPIQMLLTNAHATVTLCHSRTRDLAGEVARADIVIAAVGRPEMIKGEWIKLGAAVIDVGINRREDGTLVGDVEFGAALERAGAITPVPGGVGPMTIAMLLSNTVDAATARLGA